jgi:uncharacterized RmlC-like cupin family protein
VVRAVESRQGQQRTITSAAISAQSVGAGGICMHQVTIPGGGRARAHLHQNHETAMFILSGQAGMWYGGQLEEHLTVGAGDFLYIPAGVPHLPYNLSQTEPAVAVVARTDPNDQESVLLLPELDGLHPG